MADVERWWAFAVGIVGVVGWAGGSVLAGLPRIDAPDELIVERLTARRGAILVGMLLHLTGAAMLLWPLMAVSSPNSTESWRSLAAFAAGAWVLALSFLVVGSLAAMAAVWRGPTDAGIGVTRALLDIAHIATWSASAPAAAVAVAATTAVAVQAHTVSTVVVVLAAIKVATVFVEVAGTARRRGWNAGGWAAGISGFASVAWIASVIFAIRP